MYWFVVIFKFEFLEQLHYFWLCWLRDCYYNINACRLDLKAITFMVWILWSLVLDLYRMSVKPKYSGQKRVGNRHLDFYYPVISGIYGGLLSCLTPPPCFFFYVVFTWSNKDFYTIIRANWWRSFKTWFVDDLVCSSSIKKHMIKKEFILFI